MNDTVELDIATQRQQHIEQLEESGQLVPTCLSCQKFYEFYRSEWTPGKSGPFAPPHKGSQLCESGKRPHCTCDWCW